MPEISLHSENPKEEPEKENIKPERQTGVSRFVGGNPKERKDALEEYQNEFESQKNKRYGTKIEIKCIEKRKSTEDKETIVFILDKISGFVQRYGGTAVPIRSEHIHLLIKEKMNKEIMEEVKEEGFFKLHQQYIGIYMDKNKLANAQTIVHELLHFNGFNSINVFDIEAAMQDKGLPLDRRSGLIITSKEDKDYYRWLNEAVIEELVKRFEKEYFTLIPSLQKFINEREEYKSNIIKKYPRYKERISDIAIVVKSKGKTGWLPYHYENERRRLRDLIKNIYEKNQTEFNSEEKIFNIFAEAFMSGRLLKMARLIERTHEGSVFRKLGEEI